MLKRFLFRNCHSFKNDAVLDMEAVYAMKDNTDFIRTIGSNDEKCVHILPVAAIYGKNAGGKSNIIKALIDAATNICKREHIQNIPFFLADSLDEVFEHKFEFIIEQSGNEYEYYYKANYDEVLEESLSKRHIGSTAAFSNIFNRKGQVVDLGKCLSTERKSVIKMAAKNTGTLIINHAGAIGIEYCADIYKYCESILSVTQIKNDIQREDHLNEFADSLSDKPNEIYRLSEFMKKFDTSLNGVEITRRIPADNGNTKRYIFRIKHNMIGTNNGQSNRGFPLRLESNGTLKIIELYPILVDALDNGKVLVFDELDTMLHPLVFKKIVALFNNKNTNPKNAQLIFTAHNTIIMNREDIRRDELHIVDKDDDGISSIYRLSDFEDENGKKIRMDAKYDGTYLEGLLGSIPSNFNLINVQNDQR